MVNPRSVNIIPMRLNGNYRIVFYLLFTCVLVNSQNSYIPNMEYTFEYKYLKKDSEQRMNYVFIPPFYGNGSNDNSEKNSWYLSMYFDSNTVKYYKMKVYTGKINTSQTPISYEYYNDSDEKIMEASTGIISNVDKVWLHPPRTKGFRILELTPFPYYKANEKKWEQKLTIGGELWSDKRWVEWKGNVEFINKYTNEGSIIINTKIGEIECEKIVATGESKFGKTYLDAYYSSEYGFVKLSYLLINGDRLEISLVEKDRQ